MNVGEYLLIKVKSDKKTIVVKFDCEYLVCLTEGCLTTQPRWLLCRVVYSKSDLYKVGDKPMICLPYIDELDCEVISEEKALAMAI